MQTFATTADVVRDLAPEEPVYCLRPERLAANARAFLDGFPGEVLYAVKSNPMPEVLDALYAAGVRHFDTASATEIAFVRERFAGSHAYFMHPVKGERAMREAFERHEVRHFVVDHGDELDKLRRTFPHGGVVPVVRLETPGGAFFNLSEKFGASAELSARLLRDADAAGLRPGLCFHVGSQCLQPAAFTHAFEIAARVLAESGVAPLCLDVGGGFPARYPGADVPPLADFLAAVRAGLQTLHLPADCTAFCEPGRAIVADAKSVLARVMLRKDDRLYLNDGIYGSFKGYTIGLRYPYRVLRRDGREAHGETPFTIFGPTCDSLDVLPVQLPLPADIGAGDYIEIGQLGAYSAALRTGFNGFYPSHVVAVSEAFALADDGRAARAAA